MGASRGLDDRNRDKSLHGLLVALGITGTIAGVIIAYAYAASDGAIFGITTGSSPLKNEPVAAVDSSPTAKRDDQIQQIEQKDEQPAPSENANVNEVVTASSPIVPNENEAKKTEVSVLWGSLQYVPTSVPTSNNETQSDSSTSSRAIDNSDTDANENSNRDSVRKTSTLKPDNAVAPKAEDNPPVGEEPEKTPDKEADSQCSFPAGDELVHIKLKLDGSCQIDAILQGSIKLDSSEDILNFVSGSLQGNIEAKNSDEVNVGSGTSIYGNVKSEKTADTIIGAATISGNIEVKDGNLEVQTGAEIFGNVKHDGSGSCSIESGAVIHGDIEGCSLS